MKPKRDYVIEGAWEYRHPCPWRHQRLTKLGSGYSSLQEAEEAKRKAIEEEGADHLIIVCRRWVPEPAE